MPRPARFLLPVAAVLATAVAATTGGAQEGTPAVADDPAKPLVYVFSMDALDGDRAIEQGRAPFLSRLVRGEEGGRASVLPRVARDHGLRDQPEPHRDGHGRLRRAVGHPGQHVRRLRRGRAQGLPADGGSLDPLPGQDEPAAAGQAVVTSGEAATCLVAETFFAALKRQAPDVVTAGIFGKPKLARIFETKRVAADQFDADHLYAPCEQSSSDPPYCKDDPIDPAQRYTDDEFVMREVIRTVNEGVDADGARRRPNLTFVNLPDIDQTGHVTGAREAYEAQIARTDLQIQQFVDNQKAKGLWERTVIFFTSDHSMDSTPPNFGTNSLETAFGADADAVEVVLNGSVDMVYLKDRNRPDRDEVLKRLREKAVAQSFVDEALYRRPNPLDGNDQFTLDAVHPGLAHRRRAHGRPPRHGQVAAVLRRAGQPAQRQPRRAADARPHVRDRQRRAPGPPAGDRGPRGPALRRHAAEPGAGRAGRHRADGHGAVRAGAARRQPGPRADRGLRARRPASTGNRDRAAGRPARAARSPPATSSRASARSASADAGAG
jgi:hypothetical protein